LVVFGNQIADTLMKARVRPNAECGFTPFSRGNAPGFSLLANDFRHRIFRNVENFADLPYTP
jgi:hypothetical protein